MEDKDSDIYSQLNFFRFRELSDKYLLTNDVGEYIFLGKDQFRALWQKEQAGQGGPELNTEAESFLFREPDVPAASDKLEKLKDSLFAGPSLHILVVTLRCNYNCIYCHASACGEQDAGADMTKETADKALDIAFSSTNKHIAIEFQGGEPLLNWPVVKYVIQRAREMEPIYGKDLELRLVSNFSLMTEEIYDFIIEYKVSLCTSIDGPRELHNRNRPYAKGDSYEATVKWTKRIIRDYEDLKERGYIWKPNAVPTISRFSLDYHKELVDEYVGLGYHALFLKPINPFGLSRRTWDRIGYNAEEFIEFYLQAFEYIIRLNQQGKAVQERQARIMLQKIIKGTDPNYAELRSPCGAGISQLAYNYNGDVYTCDEGRMMSMMGDENFRIGNVYENSYNEIVSHPVVRTVCTASCLDGLAGCSDCAYMPYCGVCPIYNYVEQGSIFGQMPSNDRCRINMAIFDHLFSRISDPAYRQIFESWLK